MNKDLAYFCKSRMNVFKYITKLFTNDNTNSKVEIINNKRQETNEKERKKQKELRKEENSFKRSQPNKTVENLNNHIYSCSRKRKAQDDIKKNSKKENFKSNSFTFAKFLKEFEIKFHKLKLEGDQLTFQNFQDLFQELGFISADLITEYQINLLNEIWKELEGEENKNISVSNLFIFLIPLLKLCPIRNLSELEQFKGQYGYLKDGIYFLYKSRIQNLQAHFKELIMNKIASAKKKVSFKSITHLVNELSPITSQKTGKALTEQKNLKCSYLKKEANNCSSSNKKLQNNYSNDISRIKMLQTPSSSKGKIIEQMQASLESNHNNLNEKKYVRRAKSSKLSKNSHRSILNMLSNSKHSKRDLSSEFCEYRNSKKECIFFPNLFKKSKLSQSLAKREIYKIKEFEKFVTRIRNANKDKISKDSKTIYNYDKQFNNSGIEGNFSFSRTSRSNGKNNKSLDLFKPEKSEIKKIKQEIENTKKQIKAFSSNVSNKKNKQVTAQKRNVSINLIKQINLVDNNKSTSNINTDDSKLVEKLKELKVKIDSRKNNEFLKISKKANPILKIDINLGESYVDQILVNEDDKAEDLAEILIKKHGKIKRSR